MPIYEYKCLDCDSNFEKLQKTTDEPLEKCEKCGGELAKQWSLSGFQFKGDGWYVTDYGKKKNGAAAEGKRSRESESTAKTDSTSKETKKAVESSNKDVGKKD